MNCRHPQGKTGTERHTPGPWTVFGESEARFHGDTSNPDEYNRLLPPADGHTEGCGWPYIVASPDHGLGYGRSHLASGIQSDADAYLIAAAPNMLTALYAALTYLGDKTTDDSPEANDTRTVILNAITEATRTNPDV